MIKYLVTENTSDRNRLENLNYDFKNDVKNVLDMGISNDLKILKIEKIVDDFNNEEKKLKPYNIYDTTNNRIVDGVNEYPR